MVSRCYSFFCKNSNSETEDENMRHISPLCCHVELCYIRFLTRSSASRHSLPLPNMEKTKWIKKKKKQDAKLDARHCVYRRLLFTEATFLSCNEKKAPDIGCSVNQQCFSIKQTCLLASKISSSWLISLLLIYRLWISEYMYLQRVCLIYPPRLLPCAQTELAKIKWKSNLRTGFIVAKAKRLRMLRWPLWRLTN